MSLKRILALVLALTMCFSIAFPGGVAFADDGNENVVVENGNSENKVKNNENAEEGQGGEQKTPTGSETVTPEGSGEGLENQAPLQVNLTTTPAAKTQGTLRGMQKAAQVNFESSNAPDGWVPEFYSLTDAVNAAGSSAEYTDEDNNNYKGTLENEVTMKRATDLSAVTLSRDVVLNLAGFKLTLNEGFAVSGGKLYISGLGYISGTAEQLAALDFADGFILVGTEVKRGYKVTFDKCDGTEATSVKVH